MRWRIVLGILASTMVLESCTNRSPAKVVHIGGPNGALSEVAQSVIPEFPPKSLWAGSEGLAVVLVSINTVGQVSKVELLQAPDEDMGREVVRAAKQTRFKTVVIGGIPRQATGKLFFYFTIVSGSGVVKTPPFTELIAD